MRSLKEAYAFHLEMLLAALGRDHTGRTYGPAFTAIGSVIRVRRAQGSESGFGTSRMPEA